MSPSTVLRLAEAYGVRYRVMGGRVELYADESGAWLDSTGWGLRRMMNWLGC